MVLALAEAELEDLRAEVEELRWRPAGQDAQDAPFQNLSGSNVVIFVPRSALYIYIYLVATPPFRRPLFKASVDSHARS